MVDFSQRFKVAIFVLSLAAGSSGFASGAAADEADDRAAGAAIAQELCSGCHIVDEQQRTTVPDGVPPFPLIANRPGRTTGYLRAFLSDPTPPMPHLPLSAQQVESIIVYIQSFAD